MVINEELSLCSNHAFLTFSFNLPRSTSYQRNPVSDVRLQWRLDKLKNLGYYKDYQDTCDLLLQDIDIEDHPTFANSSDAYAYIESFSEKLCGVIYSSLDHVCGRKNLSSDTYLKHFWTPEMISTLERKQFYYKKWRKASGLNCLTYWLKHQETGAHLQRLIRQRRRQTWRQFCDKMNQGEYVKAISRICRIRKNRNVKQSFSPEPDSSNRSATEAMADHLKGIFDGKLLTNSSSGTSHFNSSPFDKNSCPLNASEIIEASKDLPRKRAPGVDHIQAEMLLPIMDILTPYLLHLFTICWQWSYTPLSWRVAQVVPIHKKGSKSDPGNFRPISLTSIFRKLLEKCLYPKLQDQSPSLDIPQGGFRTARSSLDQVQCLIEICSILRRKHKCIPTLAFLDIKSA